MERAFAWLSRHRRLSKDYERFTEYSESMIYIASIHILLKRLRPDEHSAKPYASQAAA